MPPRRRAPTRRAAPALPPCRGPCSVRRAGLDPSLQSHPFGHPAGSGCACQASGLAFGIPALVATSSSPTAAVALVVQRGNFPPAPHLASFKVKTGRQGVASKKPGSIRAACSRRQIWRRFPRESDFFPAKKAAPVRGRSPRGCSGPGRSGFGARSLAAWPGQEMSPRQISTHSLQTESE